MSRLLYIIHEMLEALRFHCRRFGLPKALRLSTAPSTTSSGQTSLKMGSSHGDMGVFGGPYVISQSSTAHHVLRTSVSAPAALAC